LETLYPLITTSFAPHIFVIHWCDIVRIHNNWRPSWGKGVIGIVGIMGSKWDIEKFTGSNDFGLWKVKMQTVLTQQKCVEALKGEAAMPTSLTQAEKREMIDKAKSAIVLCLGV